MARGRKISTETLDKKIDMQKEALAKAQAKYEEEKEALAELMKLRNEMRREEIMDAIIKSERSYEEILAFIKGSANGEDE